MFRNIITVCMGCVRGPPAAYDKLRMLTLGLSKLCEESFHARGDVSADLGASALAGSTVCWPAAPSHQAHSVQPG